MTVWPEEICAAEIVFAFGQTWLVLIFHQGMHDICVAVQTEYLFLCSADGDCASSLDALGVGEVQGSKACPGEVRVEDIPPFAKVGFPHFDAGLKVHGRNHLI